MKKTRWQKLAAIALSVFMLIAMLPSAALALTEEDLAPTTTIEYKKAASETLEDGTYQFVSSTTFDNRTIRIIHHSNGTTKLDRCTTNSVGDTLTPTDCVVSQYAGTGAHDWTITAVEGGYTIQSQTSDGYYMNVGAGSAVAGPDAQVLQIARGEDGLYSISAEVDGETWYLAYTSGGWTSSTTAYPVYVYQYTETVNTPVIVEANPPTGTTENQPFSSGTAGSQYFRIPALITLEDGSLLAATDARWNITGDACSLDTIVSKSTDGGKTWNYSFANYFNDSTDVSAAYGTAFIDPAMVQTSDGTIYLLVDLWPGGVALNTAPMGPTTGTGYQEIGGVQRLVLYASPNPNYQTSSNYTHYVGSFDSEGYAPVVNVSSGETEYYVDQWYYLYTAEKKATYCQQLGSGDYVKSNVFYYNADLHVLGTSHLWLVKSTDGGATWSAPSLINDQVRTGEHHFYGVGPGRGLVTSTGRIIFPVYTFIKGYGDGNTSVIYSDDNGVTWHRSESLSWQTSEATLVEADGTLYMFARHGGYAVSTDGGATWSERKEPGANWHTGCQINAIVYSEKIDGKTAILLSAPTGIRTTGKIFVGLVQEDGSIDWKYTYSVNGSNSYAYSCLTELTDGTLGLLYENSGGSELYVNLSIEDIAAGAQIGNKRSLTIPLYGEFTETMDHAFAGFDAIDTSIVGIDVADNGDGTWTVTYTGRKEGTVTFTEPNSGLEYTVTVAPEDLVNVSVTAGETISVNVTGSDLTREADPAIAKAELTLVKAADVIGETVGSLGTDASYSGDVTGMSKALYTFTKSGSYWVISNTTSDGETVYLNITQGSPGYPNQTSSHPISITSGTVTEGSFTLQDTMAGTGGKTLYFQRNGQNHFDRNSTPTDDGATDFLLYRPAAEGEDSSAEIPGYVRVTTADGIADGGKYLIVAQVGETYFALYPSTASSTKHVNVVKVDPERELNTLDVTGVTVGVTDAMVGGTIYRITVTEDGHNYGAPVFTWAEDHTSCTAAFTCAYCGGTETVDCTVTSETTPATCTEDGRTVYTAVAAFGEEEYSDTVTLVLPATGHTTEVKGAKAATCTEDGYTGDKVCTVCGETVQKGEVIPAAGHTTEVKGAKAATCTEDGYTGDKVCTVCSETIQKGEVIPATGHTFGEPTFNWAKDHSSCSILQVCSACGTTRATACTVTSKTTAATATTAGSTVYTATVTIDGKTYTDTQTVAIPATGATTPQTGDNSAVTLSVVLLSLSAAALGIFAADRKRRAK